jgi:hypothetical protein
MQAQDEHKVLDESSQTRIDPDAWKQYSDSFPLISLKSQHGETVILVVQQDARVAGDVDKHRMGDLGGKEERSAESILDLE